MIIHFKKKIHVIMYIIEFLKIKYFFFDKISIKYGFSKFMFFYYLK